MKRIILLLCLPLVLVSACYAKEKIKIDHMKDGYRIIQTEYQGFKIQQRQQRKLRHQRLN